MEVTSKFLGLAELYEAVRRTDADKVRKALDELGKLEDGAWTETEEFNLALVNQVFKNDSSRIAGCLMKHNLVNMEQFLKVVTSHIKRKRINSNCCTQ